MTGMQWVHWSERGGAPEGAPVLVEGLPGVGHVGQLAAMHAVATLGGSLWAELHSPDFPPQAIVAPDGTAHLCCLRLWTVPAQDGAPPLVVVTGDSQPLTPHGQFVVTQEVLDRVKAIGCDTVYTLGGLGTRERKERVLGAASDAAMVERLKEHGAHFDELGPEGGIIGASGVFLGLARVRGMQAGCLMGESDGSLIDLDAAKHVLEVLGRLIGRSIPHEGIEDTADRIEDQLQFLDEVRYYAAPTEPAEHHYIG